jgi:hypothetical protein
LTGLDAYSEMKDCKHVNTPWGTRVKVFVPLLCRKAMFLTLKCLVDALKYLADGFDRLGQCTASASVL